MKPVSVLGKVDEPQARANLQRTWERGRTAPLRFAVAALALALTTALGTHALAHVLADRFGLPVEVTVIAVGFVVAFASLVGGWVHGTRVGKLTDEARRDPVTRVGNRRHWEECLAREVNSAAEAHMPLSLLMLDVDNLKKLNDAGGHHAGDIALSVVGDVLNDTCRSRDVAARFGGDEFAVLLPRTRASEARVVAERIRAEIARRRSAISGPLSAMLTVSIGICDLASTNMPQPEALFEGADRALYAAKQAGRDRVAVSEPPPPATSTVILLEHAREQRRKRASHSSG